MPIYKGLNEIDDLYYEDIEVYEVRLGEVLKYRTNQIIPLGKGTTFDVASIYHNYKKLTADNFFFTTMDSASGSDRIVVGGYTKYLTITGDVYKAYDPETGVLTLFNACGNTTNLLNCNKGEITAYLVTKPRKLIDLGFGKEFDVSNYANYRNFTEDNFLIGDIPWHNGNSHFMMRASRTYDGTWSASGNTSFTKTYNASTGKLTLNYRLYAIADGGLDTETWNMGAYVYLNPKV